MSGRKTFPSGRPNEELLGLSNQVLRRDGAKTDNLVIPLVVGVLARALIATGPSDHPNDDPESNARHLGAAQQVIDLATGGEDWENDADSYGIVADLLYDQWPGLMFFCSFAYMGSRLDVSIATRSSALVQATVDWLSTSPLPSLTESAIVTLFVATIVDDKRGSHPLLARPSRRIRVALADRMRREGLTTWPRILSAAVADWKLSTLEQLISHHAIAGDYFLHLTMNWTEEYDRQAALRARADEAEAAALAEVPSEAPTLDTLIDQETSVAELLVAGAAGEISQTRAERDRVQQERDRLADRSTRAQSHIATLERELEAAHDTIARMTADLRRLERENQSHAEQVAAEQALAEGAAPDDPATFAGRRVLLFTGVGAADARAAMVRSFVELGAAQVDVYWTDKARGPDILPPDAIVAVEVSHMGHSDWESIQDRVRRSGGWSYTGKHGAATIARATAAAWRAHLHHLGGSAG